MRFGRLSRASTIDLARWLRLDGLGTGGEGEMKRLSEFVEVMAYGRQTDRVAYVMEASALPTPAPGSKWQKVKNFSAGDEILNDPGLKEVFKTALEKGCATVTKTS
jgi:hypothetical protein